MKYNGHEIRITTNNGNSKNNIKGSIVNIYCDDKKIDTIYCGSSHGKNRLAKSKDFSNGTYARQILNSISDAVGTFVPHTDYYKFFE